MDHTLRNTASTETFLAPVFDADDGGPDIVLPASYTLLGALCTPARYMNATKMTPSQPPSQPNITNLTCPTVVTYITDYL